jgi:hypothetical protein
MRGRESRPLPLLFNDAKLQEALILKLRTHYYSSGFEYLGRATPVLESASFPSFVLPDGAPIKIAHSNLEPLNLLRFSSTVFVLRIFSKYSNYYFQFSDCIFRDFFSR